MSYINLRLTQGQAKFLLDRLSADKASCLEEVRKAGLLNEIKTYKFNKTLVSNLNPIINDLYLELNEEKESYNGR